MKRLTLKREKPTQRLLLAFYLIAILLFCHHFIFRPIILDWGAPEQLRKMSLSGDILTEGKTHTRAVLINASPEEIWPWLIQVGQDRGGFYSYEWLENVFQADMRNSYAINPKFQFPRMQGDTIWLANKDHYNGGGYQIVAETTPFKSLVMVGGQDYARLNKGEKAKGSWAFYLYPENPNMTWLIARSSEGETNFGNKVLRYFCYEVPHFVMERKMLLTLERLVESSTPRSTNGADVSRNQ